MKNHSPFPHLLSSFALAILISLTCVPVNAQERRRSAEGGVASGRNQNTSEPKLKDDGKKEEPKADKKEPKDELSETTNSATIGGVEVKYKTTTGTIVMKDEEGKPHATIFFVAYTRLDGTTNASERPIMFSFNGGPGSSSVLAASSVCWGRSGFFSGEDGGLPPPPFHLVNNESSMLDECDLVFIDPVSTGYSRPVAGEDANKFHGVEQDLESVGDFIRLYTSRYNRWASPKFIIGESYGTTRAAGLSGHLEERYGMYLNGIALISAVLDFSTISFNPGNDMPYVLYLPSETAAAWYHKKLAADLQLDLKKALAESEEYALGDYTKALDARRCAAGVHPAKNHQNPRASDGSVRGFCGPRGFARECPAIFQRIASR